MSHIASDRGQQTFKRYVKTRYPARYATCLGVGWGMEELRNQLKSLAYFFRVFLVQHGRISRPIRLLTIIDIDMVT